jgi:hypothetical protein
VRFIPSVKRGGRKGGRKGGGGGGGEGCLPPILHSYPRQTPSALPSPPPHLIHKPVVGSVMLCDFIDGSKKIVDIVEVREGKEVNESDTSSSVFIIPTQTTHRMIAFRAFRFWIFGSGFSVRFWLFGSVLAFGFRSGFSVLAFGFRSGFSVLAFRFWIFGSVLAFRFWLFGSGFSVLFGSGSGFVVFASNVVVAVDNLVFVSEGGG